jgi:hypothetical protein
MIIVTLCQPSSSGRGWPLPCTMGMGLNSSGCRSNSNYSALLAGNLGKKLIWYRRLVSRNGGTCVQGAGPCRRFNIAVLRHWHQKVSELVVLFCCPPQHTHTHTHTHTHNVTHTQCHTHTHSGKHTDSVWQVYVVRGIWYLNLKGWICSQSKFAQGQILTLS